MQKPLWLTAAVAATVSCSSVEYVPVTPRTGEAGGATAEVKRIDVGVVDNTITPQIDLVAPEGTELGAASWHSVDVAPCTPGGDPTVTWVDERVPWRGRPVAIGGSHRLAFEFPADPTSSSRTLDAPTALDLELVGRDRSYCLRIPAAGPKPEMAFDLANVLTLNYAVGYEFSSRTLRGLYGRFVFGLSLSRWFGRTRAGVTSGFGLTQCDRATCPQSSNSEDGTLHDALVPFVPVALELEWIALQSGALAIGTEVRYHVEVAWPSTYTGVETRWLHGPEAALNALFTLPAPPDAIFPMGPRVLSIGIGIPVGLWFDPAVKKPATLIGAALTGSFWL